jgi:hypothetical protein
MNDVVWAHFDARDWNDLDYLACSKDFFYWLENYGMMRDESTGEIVGPGIKLWPDQVTYMRRYRAGEWLICGKARQVGLSWLATQSDLYDILFQSNVGLGVIAQSDFWAKFHLDRLTWLYDQQPAHIRRFVPVVGQDNTHMFGLNNGSSFSAYPCTAGQARGAGRKRLRLEEMAFWAVDAERVLAAVKGATKDHGQLVIISTGNGEGGAFHKSWLEAERGSGDFRTIFLPWTSRPGRPANFRDGMSALERQEWPESPTEMFLASGVKYFDLQILAQQQATDEVLVEGDGFDGKLEIFEAPIPGVMYVIGADIADGGGDACSIDVGRVDTGEQVAHLTDFNLGADECGDVLYNLGKRYNWAYLGAERNNNGAAALAILIRRQYPRLYYHQHYDPQAAQTRPRAGWLTDTNSRPVMLADLRTAINDPGSNVMHHPESFRQLRIFGFYKGKWQHPPGDHDDGVISLAIMQQMRQIYRTISHNSDVVVYLGDECLTG